MKDYFVELTSYNTWANNKMLQLVTAAGEDRSVLVQVSSFPSIKQTLLHILDAQFIWYQRLHGTSPVSGPGKNFNGTAAEAASLLVESSREFELYVSSLSAQDLGTMINYKTIKGDPFSNTIGEILAHAMNHATFHRGQLITLLRGAGSTEMATTDLIAFFRERRK